jgi:natural resistance-associated macrophage protein 2
MNQNFPNNLGCSDIQEVIGTALALAILTGGALPLWAGVMLSAVSAYCMLFLDRLGALWLERFFQLAVAVMGVCMAALFFLADVPYGQVMKGLLVPSMPSKALPTAAGLLGSIIMPHNLYLHSALVHARPLVRGTLRRPNLRESVKYYNLEAGMALGITLLINISVISVFARGFFGHKQGPIGLQNAGEFLGQRFGSHVELIWAIGLLSSGQSSTMTGTYAGQHVMSGFFNFKISPFARALVTRAFALCPTLLVALSTRADSSSLDVLNQWLNVLQSVQLPFVIVPLLAFTSAPGIMGLGFVSSKGESTVSWAIALSIMAVNLGTVYETAVHHLPAGVSFIQVLFWGVVSGYIIFVGYLMVISRRLKHHVPQLDEVEVEGLEEPLLRSHVDATDRAVTVGN